MANEDGSVVVVYNGEIYNYPELRSLVLARGHRLKTHCDTEVLPHLYEDEGIAFAARLNGIFAFALFDQARPQAVPGPGPARGEAAGVLDPGRHAGLRVRSQGRARERARLQPRLDEASLHLSMNVRYVPGDRTFFRNIERLPPGHVLEFAEGQARLQPYAAIDWTPDESIPAGRLARRDPVSLPGSSQAAAHLGRAGRCLAVWRHRLEFDRGHAPA